LLHYLCSAFYAATPEIFAFVIAFTVDDCDENQRAAKVYDQRVC
jgi:hypothetical protein